MNLQSLDQGRQQLVHVRVHAVRATLASRVQDRRIDVHAHIYVGNLVEKVVGPTTTDWKHYVFVNGEARLMDDYLELGF